MGNKEEKSVAVVLEDVTFILNEIRNRKFKDLEKTKLNSNQEKILIDIEKDLNVCTTKIGKILHTVEL